MIHEFKNGHWVPGDAQRDGGHAFPAQPGVHRFFNDVTGASGPTEAAVREPLSALLMKQGSFLDLLPRLMDWSGFMMRLRMAAGRFTSPDREFGRAAIRPDGSIIVTPAAGWPAPVVQEAARIAYALVRANGQMDFIRAQPWFHSGSHRVTLVLEQEFGRSAEFLQFHQDTIGDALFSNLVFRNADGLPAPEWSPNLEPMPADKRALVARRWPPALLQSVDAERARLAATPGSSWPIEGGTLPRDGFVSWIDELVWHSTPVLEHRPRYTVEEVNGILQDASFDQATYDLLVQIVQTPGSRTAARLLAQGVAPSAFDEPRAQRFWHEIHADTGHPQVQDLLRDAQQIDWSQRVHDTAWAAPLIHDQPDGNEVFMTQPSGMVGRPRRNSENLDALTSATGTDRSRDFMQVVVTVQPAH